MRLELEQQQRAILEQIAIGIAHRRQHVLAGGPRSLRGVGERRMDAFVAATHEGEKSADLVGNRRNRYACEMPAARAMSSVGVPWTPRAAKPCSAARSTASRRTSEVESRRVVAGAEVSMRSLTLAVKGDGAGDWTR